MNRRKRSGIPSSYLFIILSILCIVMLMLSYATDFTAGPIKTVSNYIFVPMQKGLDYIGNNISTSNEEAMTKEELIAENQKLQEQVDELTTQITNIELQQTELTELQQLFELEQQYDYQTTGARVIAKGTNNWFSTFTINKGSADGIKTDMNVIAGSGLVGIVTDVGKNYAVVRSIIDDTSNVSGMILSTSDNCIVSGSLELMTDENQIELSNLEDEEDAVSVGDAVVTSNISDKYMPGLLIGYVTSIETDSNKLTKSGSITPVVDFKHLQEVLVILEVKDTGK